ncbi:MAG: hypothetical protein KAR06_11140 [Deltaproteobacteria bacterium]|nr:hypothetical protein [Deltaproteobacteria bacterium]
MAQNIDQKYDEIAKGGIVLLVGFLQDEVARLESELKDAAEQRASDRMSAEDKFAELQFDLREKNSGLGNKVVALEAEIAVLKASPKKKTRGKAS